MLRLLQKQRFENSDKIILIFIINTYKNFVKVRYAYIYM